MTKHGILHDLIALSHDLGAPERNWAILGEGNTSARVDRDTFLVKASGSQLSTLDARELVRVRFAPLVDALESECPLDDDTVRDILRTAVDDPSTERMPSVETLFHALLLNIPGVAFVGHTHVTSINGILCSDAGWAALQQGGRLFPDEVVVCGIAPCCIPYTDPGLPLARAIQSHVRCYDHRYGETPKTIYLQNHGLIALGRSAREVLSITQMADKAAQILLATLAAGGPRFLSDADVRRIANRPDEHVRQRALGLKD
jgi:rhamnose utilization protein RhaD (predicted bifunctional aldolase and dehydrogenase)